MGLLKFDEPPSLLDGMESLVSNRICHEDLPWAMFKNGLIQMMSIIVKIVTKLNTEFSNT
jgi:hypothetical protein